MKIISMFHYGMRARVQLDDGDFSAWFNACQGSSARMCAAAVGVEHFICDGYHSGSAAVRGGLEHAPKG